jgi:hypothetical protein
MDIAFGTRLTPTDKVRARPGYRCTACRQTPRDQQDRPDPHGRVAA